ncbi:MAG TPA: hypothetical protein VFL13_04240, partial [Candidatus Baltobacteraceae bacterium]|nr:hypothetical protein [Candidatus Baltobacteraceae bacterium]
MIAPLVATIAAVPPADAVAALLSSSGRNAMQTSLAASMLAIGFAALLGVPAGFGLARLPRAPQGALLSVLALPLAFPPVASGIMLLELLGTRTSLGSVLAAHGVVFVDSLWGVAAAEFFVAGSLVAITSAAAFAA